MWRMACLALFFSSSIAMADTVVLVSNDGFISLQGELVEVDNKFYVLNTSVGEVRIPISEVICRGLDCPAAAASPAGQKPPALTQDEKHELFRRFVEWRKKNENTQVENEELFRSFLKWQSKNAN